jgi:hypothetical protein
MIRPSVEDDGFVLMEVWGLGCVRGGGGFFLKHESGSDEGKELQDRKTVPINCTKQIAS